MIGINCSRYNYSASLHCDGGLEVEPLEVSGGVADTDQEEGGEEGGEQLVGEPPLESYFHLYSLLLVI